MLYFVLFYILSATYLSCSYPTNNYRTQINTIVYQQFQNIFPYFSQKELDNNPFTFNKKNQWDDVSSDFSKKSAISIQLQNVQQNFIEADTIIKQMREKYSEADINETESKDDPSYYNILFCVAQIKKLYQLAQLSEKKRFEYDQRIRCNYQAALHNNQSLSSIYQILFIAEEIVAEIFNNTQKLGLYPDGYPD